MAEAPDLYLTKKFHSYCQMIEFILQFYYKSLI